MVAYLKNHSSRHAYICSKANRHRIELKLCFDRHAIEKYRTRLVELDKEHHSEFHYGFVNEDIDGTCKRKPVHFKHSLVFLQDSDASHKEMSS